VRASREHSRRAFLTWLLIAGREQCLRVARQVKRSLTWPNSTKPGEKVQTSGIYEVVKEGDGGSGFQVTCVEGEHFPPTRSGKGAGYEPVTWGAQLCGESGILFADRLPRESCRDP
jgi:hypothetical protein